MIDLKDKTALEFHFADHFDTALFPVLADIYLKSDWDIHQTIKMDCIHWPKFIWLGEISKMQKMC